MGIKLHVNINKKLLVALHFESPFLAWTIVAETCIVHYIGKSGGNWSFAMVLRWVPYALEVGSICT